MPRPTCLIVLGLLGAIASCRGSPPTGPTGTTGTLIVIAPKQMFPGESLPATAVPVPPLAGSWESSDTSVAAVSPQGVVTAVAPGTTRLKVTYAGEDGSALMTVYGDADVLGVTIQDCPTGLSVLQTTVCLAFAALRDGGSKHVSIPAGWSSSATAVASVDKGGFVIARSRGNATISATFHGKTGSREISVTGGDQDQIRITATAKQGTFQPGTEVELWLQGYFSVVSGPGGGLTLQVSDQNGVVAASGRTVQQGVDSFVMSSRFTIPANSTRVCPVMILRVGNVTTATAPDDPLLYCVNVVR